VLFRSDGLTKFSWPIFLPDRRRVRRPALVYVPENTFNVTGLRCILAISRPSEPESSRQTRYRHCAGSWQTYSRAAGSGAGLLINRPTCFPKKLAVANEMLLELACKTGLRSPVCSDRRRPKPGRLSCVKLELIRGQLTAERSLT